MVPSRIVGVCLIVLVTLVLCSGVSVTFAQGERPAGEDARDERVELVISYTREETPRQDAAANIKVVRREEIERIPAHDAAEVLQYVPGVNVFFTGGPGGFSEATIQGSDSRQVAVFKDGVRLNLLANPVTNLRSIPVETIERIEVVEGAASSAWGSALGGVINIITREPDPTHPIRAEVTNWVGQFGTFRNSETVSGTIDRWGYLASLSHKQSDGFMDHTGFYQDSFYAKLNYAPNPEGRLSLVASYDRGRSEDPVIKYPSFWDDIHEERFYQRLLFEQSCSNGVSFAFEGRHQKSSYDTYDVYPSVRHLYFDYAEETVGFGARVSQNSEKNRFLLGFDGDWGEYSFENDEGAHDQGVSTGDWAVYANDSYRIGGLVLNGGLRLDDNQHFGSEISPSLGAVYHFPWKNALLRAQIAKGFFAPPPRWLYDARYGNPDLEPETAINTQVGFEIQPFKNVTAVVNVFRADIDNMIIYDPNTEFFDNIGHVNRKGIEGTVKFTPAPWLSVAAGAYYADVRDEDSGDVVAAVPRSMLTLSATAKWRWTTHSIVGKWVDYPDAYDQAGNLTSALSDRVFVFDYLLSARLPIESDKVAFDAFFAVHDLTNAGFLYSVYYPQPGRWVETGLTVRF